LLVWHVMQLYLLCTMLEKYVYDRKRSMYMTGRDRVINKRKMELFLIS